MYLVPGTRYIVLVRGTRYEVVYLVPGTTYELGIRGIQVYTRYEQKEPRWYEQGYEVPGTSYKYT